MYKKFYIFLLILCLSSSLCYPEKKDVSSTLYINGLKATPSAALTEKQRESLFETIASFSNDKIPSKPVPFYHVVKSVDASTGELILTDGSVWKLGWWHRGTLDNWVAGDRLQISHQPRDTNDTYFKNIDIDKGGWGVLVSWPPTMDTVASLTPRQSDPTTEILELTSGTRLQAANLLFSKQDCKQGNKIFLFHDSTQEERYHVWDLTHNKILFPVTCIKSTHPTYRGHINSQSVLKLERSLNKRVIAQTAATKTVTTAIANYCAYLENPNTPIGVFLFLGPTGVGKTELAKALTQELFPEMSYLTRFDMSHFAEPHSFARLIGSPPGYVNHEEGGQLTNAIQNKPQSIVLLDEIEKAHPQVRKIFLPVFDEGYIIDSKNTKFSCHHLIFILTSNLCASEIVSYFNQGYHAEEILALIEPQLIEGLSPELYNRIEPIVFEPLRQESMEQILNLLLDGIKKKVKASKNVKLVIDESVKTYLIKEGYHPTLGARPLKRLIEKKVTASLSHAFMQDPIPENSTVVLSYKPVEDTWHVDWY
jgi:hypothetical protein